MTTELRPLAYLCLVGTSAINILPINPSRKGLLFYNPSANTVSVAPFFGATFTGGAFGIPPGQTGLFASIMSVNGPGTVSILSGGMLSIPQPGWGDTVGLGAAWNAIASGPNTNFTVWEF